jgi:DNA (cytosine-5)-methyltransferase 1
MIRYASVCSGVEAPSLAWEGLGWEAQWFSEIEEFPSEVLSQRFPNTPNLGDMTKLVEKEIFHERKINLLVGGTPCQSFSVAGLQRGLDDPRGNLALEFVRLLYIKQPEWFIWENVPNVLSVNGGRDFNSILSAFAKIGYHLSWRVLDSKFFGVPQKRRRLFVVGHIRDWRYPAAVLLEPESLQGTSGKSKEKRKDTPTNTRKSSFFDMRGFGDYGEGSASSTLKARDGKDFTDLIVEPYGYSKSHRDSGKVDIRFTEDGKANTLSCGDGCGNQSSLNIVGVVYNPTQITNPNNRSNPKDGDPSPTLTKHSDPFLYMRQGVRRLTPLECERLQGFPDNHTDILWKGKPAPPTLRYRAIGNSMAVPVMKWIGSRINFLHNFDNAQNFL